MKCPGSNILQKKNEISRVIVFCNKEIHRIKKNLEESIMAIQLYSKHGQKTNSCWAREHYRGFHWWQRCEKIIKTRPGRRWEEQWRRSWSCRAGSRTRSWRRRRTTASPGGRRWGWTGRGGTAGRWWTALSWAAISPGSSATTNTWTTEKIAIILASTIDYRCEDRKKSLRVKRGNGGAIRWVLTPSYTNSNQHPQENELVIIARRCIWRYCF